MSDKRVIIFNVPSPSNPFYLPIIEAARKRAESGGYILLENESDLSSSSSMDRFLSMLITTKAAGTIIANAMTSEGLARIGRAVPAVMCSESAEGSDVPYVIIDNAGAAYSAVRYLLSSGRRRIAMLNGPSSYMYSGDRYSGYRRGESFLIFRNLLTPSSAFRICLRLLRYMLPVIPGSQCLMILP